jgi:hypothetical protein
MILACGLEKRKIRARVAPKETKKICGERQERLGSKVRCMRVDRRAFFFSSSIRLRIIAIAQTILDSTGKYHIQRIIGIVVAPTLFLRSHVSGA